MSLAIIVDQAVLPAVIQFSPEVHVPSLAGLPFDTAKRRLDSLGLVVKGVREQYSATVPEGCVMSQMPFPGSVVKQGRHIYLTVSSGEETVTVPQLEGLSLRDARVTIMRVGLSVGDIVYQSSDSIANGIVVRQSSPSRSLVPYGTSIQLIVSNGPTGSFVPDVQGQTLDVATEVLLSAGFSLGRVSYVQSGLFEPHTVVRQTPRDTIVPKGTPIDVDVVR
jgi:serine/threonine-protein kinase